MDRTLALLPALTESQNWASPRITLFWRTSNWAASTEWCSAPCKFNLNFSYFSIVWQLGLKIPQKWHNFRLKGVNIQYPHLTDSYQISLQVWAPSLKPQLATCYLKSTQHKEHNYNNPTSLSIFWAKLPHRIPVLTQQTPNCTSKNPRGHHFSNQSHSPFFQARCGALQQQEQPNLLFLPLLTEHRKYSFFLLLFHFQFAHCPTMTVSCCQGKSVFPSQ